MANAYNELLEIMGGATVIEPSFFIGKVKSPFPELEISLNDIVLDKDDLLVDKWIKDRNEELFTEYEGHSHGDATGDGNHRHEIREKIHDKLMVDDKVVLLRIEEKFIVLSKVVGI